MNNRTTDFTTFKRSFERMISKNSAGDRSDYTRRRTSKLKDYSLEEVQRIINSGSLDEQQRLSRNYYEKDGIYKRIILYYATLLTYTGLLIPNPKEGKQLSNRYINKRYFAALDYLEKLNLSDLFIRMSIEVLTCGSYYGLLQNLDKNNCVIFDLPQQYCASRFKDLLGNDIVEFDVRYFNSILKDTTREEVLRAYPKIISDYYKKYSKGKISDPWIKLPTDLGIYFSFYDSNRPLFLSVIPATIQYDDAIDTDRERDKEEIKKILVQKIPHLNDGQLLFEPEEAVEIHSGAVGMMRGNKNLSVLTTYADVDAIVSKTTADTVNNSIDKAQQNIYTNAGATSLIFAPVGTQAIPYSIKNDIALMMILGNRYGSFITYILNILFANNNINFKYLILPISEYTKSEYIQDTLKLAQSGYSFLLPGVASGLNQLELINVKHLENEVLGLKELLIPLSSSYTESGSGSDSDVGGAPEKKLEDKSQKTIQNENAINNQGGSE